MTLAADLEPGDVLICDPPYSEHVHTAAVSNNPGGIETGTRPRDFGFDHLTPELRDDIVRLAQGTKRWCVIFSDIESVGSVWQPALGRSYVRSVPWVRWSQPQKSGDRPGSGCEMIVLAHRSGGKQWNGYGGLTHYTAKSLRGKDKYSAEKPLDLMLSLVSHYSRPGERVVDPTMGMGTTGVACALLWRDFRGAEARPEISAAAWERVGKAYGDGTAATVDRSSRGWWGVSLSDRDRERAERWVADMLDVFEREQPTTPQAFVRRARGLADVMTVAERLGI